MVFALATANSGKVKEMQEILSQLDIDILTRDDLGIAIEVEETGTTFFENAVLKAKAICEASNMPAIADDSGLIVDALGGQPGVYTSSFGGVDLSAEERCLFLLSKLKNMEHRDAKFVCTIVCAFPDGEIITATGECCGTIAKEPRGINGFGYDPVFIPAGYSKTNAELTSIEKNTISHRGNALRKFVKVLISYLQAEKT